MKSKQAIGYIGSFCKSHWQWLILVLLCAVMFSQYAFISLRTEAKFYSPDETANYFFIKQFHDTGRLYAIEPLNVNNHNVILPRSVNILDDKLVPQSFPGMLFIYGLLSKVVGMNAIPFVSPILALFTVLIFYAFIKTIFEKNIAFISAITLLILPAFWFNSGKAMLHITLFCFFLVSGLYFLYKQIDKYNVLMKFVSGLLLGSAIFVRASEIVWLFPAIVIAVLLNRKKLGKNIWAILIGFILPIIGILLLNLFIYGKLLSVGYQSLDIVTVQTNALFGFVSSVLLPFGLSIRAIALQVFEYFLKYTWYIVAPGILSMVYLARNWRQQNTEVKSWLGFSFVSMVIALFYYGNYWPWGQSGQPEVPTFLIGSPHVRYWLPIVILLIPFAVYFIYSYLPRLINWQTKKIKLIFVVVLLLSISIISFNQVMLEKEEGYLKIVNDIQEFEPRLVQIEKLVSRESILVIPDWADRIFFPEYPVIISPEDELVHAGNVFLDVANLINSQKVYYYSASSEKDIDDLKTNKLKLVGLELKKIAEIYKGERLYEFVKLKK